MTEIDLIFKAVRNAHRRQYLETQQVLFKELDWKTFQRISKKLAELQLIREISTEIDLR